MSMTPEKVAAKHFEAFENDCPPAAMSKEQWRDALMDLIDLCRSALEAVNEELGAQE